jgi:hypothetical protein
VIGKRSWSHLRGCGEALREFEQLLKHGLVLISVGIESQGQRAGVVQPGMMSCNRQGQVFPHLILLLSPKQNKQQGCSPKSVRNTISRVTLISSFQVILKGRIGLAKVVPKTDPERRSLSAKVLSVFARFVRNAGEMINKQMPFTLLVSCMGKQIIHRARCL